jgi:hypothetical protein
VEPLPPDRGEIDDVWGISRRSLHNASVPGLTEDGRCLFAYMAVRTLATVAIRVEGYRVTARGGAHFNTFEALRAVPSAPLAERADYLDDCRRKRNEASYEVVLVSRTEADALLLEARAFHEDLVAWFVSSRPDWVPRR